MWFVWNEETIETSGRSFVRCCSRNYTKVSGTAVFYLVHLSVSLGAFFYRNCLADLSPSIHRLCTYLYGTRYFITVTGAILLYLRTKTIIFKPQQNNNSSILQLWRTCKILWTQTLLLMSSHVAERVQAAGLGLGAGIWTRQKGQYFL
jgi:hypothetical protein